MKNLLLSIFAITCLLQWFVPLNMIWSQEKILKEGTVFKFKTRPVDPTDPFRGKYIVLNFEADIFKTSNLEAWEEGDKVYVLIKNDDEGFAQIATIEKTKPLEKVHFIEATIKQIWGKNPYRIQVSYPFERFYMEENKAPEAEKLVRQLMRQTDTQIYAKVWVKAGKAALDDVIVGDESIKTHTKIQLIHQ